MVNRAPASARVSQLSTINFFKMSRYLDKVLAHAERQLAPGGGACPAEILPLYKKFLRIEEHRLRLQHRAGGGGREICAGRSNLVDLLLEHVFAAADTF